jgi:hypothetical protein
LWQASSQPLAELQDPAPQNGWFGLVVGPYWKQNVQENHGRDCITSISIILIFDDFGWKKTWMSPLVFPWNKPQIARGLLGARSTSSTACGAKTLWVLDQRDAIAQIAHEESLFRSPHVMLHQGPERCRVVFTIPNWGFFLGILWSPGNGMFLICLMTLKHSWSMEPGECQWDGLGFTTLELYLHLLNWRVPPAFCFVDHVLRNLGHCSHFSEKKYKKCVVKPHRFFLSLVYPVRARGDGKLVGTMARTRTTGNWISELSTQDPGLSMERSLESFLPSPSRSFNDAWLRLLRIAAESPSCPRLSLCSQHIPNCFWVEGTPNVNQWQQLVHVPVWLGRIYVINLLYSYNFTGVVRKLVTPKAGFKCVLTLLSGWFGGMAQI